MEEGARQVIVRFTVPGEPRGKQRPRIYKDHAGNSRAVTPKETVTYENLIKWVYQNTPGAMKLEGEIEAKIVACFAIPKSMTKKNRALVEEGKLRPTKTPDTDNIAKLVLDGLNGLAYADDRQVVKLVVEKQYSENPGVLVVLEEVGFEKK